jgi:hypothetical protein
LVVRLWHPTDPVTSATAPVASAPVGDETIATLVNEPGPVVPEDLATLDDATLANLGDSLEEEIGGLSEAGLI